MLADLVKWAKLDKEIGAKLDREDAERVENKGGLSRLFDTCGGCSQVPVRPLLVLSTGRFD